MKTANGKRKFVKRVGALVFGLLSVLCSFAVPASASSSGPSYPGTLPDYDVWEWNGDFELSWDRVQGVFTDYDGEFLFDFSESECFSGQEISLDQSFSDGSARFTYTGGTFGFSVPSIPEGFDYVTAVEVTYRYGYECVNIRPSSLWATLMSGPSLPLRILSKGTGAYSISLDLDDIGYTPTDDGFRLPTYNLDTGGSYLCFGVCSFSSPEGSYFIPASGVMDLNFPGPEVLLGIFPDQGDFFETIELYGNVSVKILFGKILLPPPDTLPPC